MGRTESGGTIERGRVALGELLLDPDAFYEHRVGRSGLRIEALLVLLVGVVGAAGVAYGVQSLADSIRVGAAPASGGAATSISENAARALYGRILRPLFGSFILWIAYTTAFYAISWFYTERGTYYRVLKNTAWGFVPLLVGNLLYSAALAVAFWGETVDRTPGAGSPQRIATWLLDRGRTEPVVILTGLLLIGAIAWGGYIWTHGVAHARRLEPDDARLVVVLPVAVHAGYQLWTVVQLLP